MVKTAEQDKILLSDFVALFTVEEYDIYGEKNWQPFACPTRASSLSALYALLPGSFPLLYEHLVLCYRWPQADLPTCTLLANPAGSGLDGLLSQVQSDKSLWDTLVPSGYVQFGRDRGGNYDPICFDTRHGWRDDDCRIVQIDHEEILCNRRIKEVGELAGGFREFVELNLGHSLSKRAA